MRAEGSPRVGRPPQDQRLPNGFTVVLDEAVVRADGGRTLFGGSPARMLYLRPEAVRLLGGSRLTVRDAAGATLARILLDRGMAHPQLPARPASAAEVSVVVPVRDRPRELARLLSGLAAELDVVVVDDGSTSPRTAEVARAAGARVVRQEVSLGPAAARNRGLAEVAAPLVAFVDSDVVPRPGWLEALLPHFEDPALALVAPRVAGPLPVPSARPGGWVARYEQARSSLDMGASPAPVRPRGRVAYVPTAAVLARVSALGGGFAEQLQVGEDVDLVWRLVEAGWRVRYEPAGEVSHEHRVQVGEWLSRKAFYGTSAAPLALRHPGSVPVLASSPWAATVWALLLLQRRWSWVAAAAVTGAATARLARRLTRSDHPWRAAARLTPYGLVSTGWQTASLLMRHWWPLTAAACLVSRRARRAALVAALVEAAADRHRVAAAQDLVGYTVAHRLDDLAYGAGLWAGAWRYKTWAPLRPAISARASAVPSAGSTAGGGHRA